MGHEDANMVEHVIVVNNQIQELMWMGSLFVFDEANKYNLLKDALISEVHKGMLDTI